MRYRWFHSPFFYYSFHSLRLRGRFGMCSCIVVTQSRPDHAAAVIDFALAFCSEVEDINRQLRQLHKSTQPYNPLRVRVGVNTGKLTSGVICTSLKAFDVYGGLSGGIMISLSISVSPLSHSYPYGFPPFFCP